MCKVSNELERYILGVWKRRRLENTSDTIEQHGMWQILRVCGAGGKFLKAVQSFHVDSTAFIRVGMDVNEWLPFNVGLRQDCVMSLWLISVYMDGVVREVIARMAGTVDCERWYCLR